MAEKTTPKKAPEKNAEPAVVTCTSAESLELQLLRSIDASLRTIAACVQQTKNPDERIWLKTREFG